VRQYTVNSEPIVTHLPPSNTYENLSFRPGEHYEQNKL
jgi:hypothetical protein